MTRYAAYMSTLTEGPWIQESRRLFEKISPDQYDSPGVRFLCSRYNWRCVVFQSRRFESDGITCSEENSSFPNDQFSSV